jgi:hypothetical protein
MWYVADLLDLRFFKWYGDIISLVIILVVWFSFWCNISCFLFTDIVIMSGLKKTVFRDEWTLKPEFIGIQKGKVKTEAYCTICKKVLQLSNMGIMSLKSHVKPGTKHNKLMLDVKKSANMHFFTTAKVGLSSSCPSFLKLCLVRHLVDIWSIELGFKSWQEQQEYIYISLAMQIQYLHSSTLSYERNILTWNFDMFYEVSERTKFCIFAFKNIIISKMIYFLLMVWI